MKLKKLTDTKAAGGCGVVQFLPNIMFCLIIVRNKLTLLELIDLYEWSSAK